MPQTTVAAGWQGVARAPDPSSLSCPRSPDRALSQSSRDGRHVSNGIGSRVPVTCQQCQSGLGTAMHVAPSSRVDPVGRNASHAARLSMHIGMPGMSRLKPGVTQWISSFAEQPATRAAVAIMAPARHMQCSRAMAFRTCVLTLLLLAASCACPAADGPDDLTIVLQAQQPLPDGTYEVEIASTSTTLLGKVRVTGGVLACVDECLFDALGPDRVHSLSGHLVLDETQGAHRFRAELVADVATSDEVRVIVRRGDVVLAKGDHAPDYKEQERCPGTTAATVNVAI
jgi:hypothetical protein